MCTRDWTSTLRVRSGLDGPRSGSIWTAAARSLSGVEPVRWVHLASALLWTTSALIGLWWARSVAHPRHRRWLSAIGVLALVIGGENLLQATSPHHPRSVTHLVANLMLAGTGVLALFLVAAHGRGIAVEERVLRVLSGRRLEGRARHRPDPPPLTPREIEVVTCLCHGLSTDEIARRLCISPHTATTHIRNILRKLEVGSRADAVAWAVEHGLLDGPVPRLPRIG